MAHAGSPQEQPQPTLPAHLSRRAAVHSLTLGAALLLPGCVPALAAETAAAAAAPPSSTSDDPSLVTFTNPAQGYSLRYPSTWEQASCCFVWGGAHPKCVCVHTLENLLRCTQSTPLTNLPTTRAPRIWQVDKAGADSLFRDPQHKSTNVGVTVYPVLIGR